MVQVHNQGVVVVSLTSRLVINADGTGKLSQTSAVALFKRPAKHRAFGDAITPREFLAGTSLQTFGPHLLVETLGPFDPFVKRLTQFPGTKRTRLTVESSHREASDDRMLEDGQIPNGSGATLLGALADTVALWANDRALSTLQM